MQNQPFFSIVIPTKNRPGYLKESIESVLLQNFEDYELIVSDNYNDHATQEVINEFKDHPKFSSYRTSEELNMINHWEFATQKAKGKYVLLLADRKVLFQGVLQRMKRDLENYPNINAFSFGVRMFDETAKKILPSDKFSNTVEIHKTSDLIENFLDVNTHQQASFDAKFPKTLNGCYRRTYADEIRTKFGNYFNTNGVTTPDYSSLFINLSLNEEIAHLGYPVILAQGEGVSNGRNFGNGQVEKYMASLKLEAPFSKVPMKGPFIYNLLSSDYMTIREKFKGNLEHQQLNLVNYFATTKFELNRKLSIPELDSTIVDEFTHAWEKAFAELNSAEKVAIEVREKKYETDLSNWNLGIRKKSVSDYITIIKTKISALPLLNRFLDKKYNNGLHAANFRR